MAEFLNSDEEQRRWEEARQYADEYIMSMNQRIMNRPLVIEEERINGKAKRQKQDKLFQKAVILVFAVVLILLVISWAR